ARPDARGRVQWSAPRAAPGLACPHRRGPGGARRGPGRRAGRAPGAPCPAGRGVGQGPAVLPPGWGESRGPFRVSGIFAYMQKTPYREAVACHEGALDALQRLPDSRQTRALAIDLRFKLRHALTPLGEFARGFAALREAATLAEALDDPP